MKIAKPEHNGTLWIGAFRYYLGRQSYAVSDFVDLLVLEWQNLSQSTKILIKKELSECFNQDDKQRAEGQCERLPLGMDVDRAQWERIRVLP